MSEIKHVYAMLTNPLRFEDVGGKENHFTGFTREDMDKVVLHDTSIDYGNTAIAKFARFSAGRSVTAEHFPKSFSTVFPVDLPDVPMTRENRHHRLSHIFRMADKSHIVSGAFGDAVERFDPGQHQFAPITYEHAPDYRFYWFVPNVRLLCPFDPDLSYPKMRPVPKEIEIDHGWVNPFPDGPSYVFDVGPGPRDGPSFANYRLAFRREAIAGHHLFCPIPMHNMFFVTDVLRDALRQACPHSMGFEMESDVV